MTSLPPLLLSIWSLLLLASVTVQTQQLSPQLQAVASDVEKYPLYNYTLDGQTLYTVCPCKSRWTFTQADGSLVELSGCANPDNDPAGPFCEVDVSTRRCPSSETKRMDNKGRRLLVTACLPHRTRTLAGCLCNVYWSERDDITLANSWPVMPRQTLLEGLHTGWLLAGNCSRALNLPGGARCTVVEGSCSVMPAKAYPPPTPSIFWQINSIDRQGWDFCGDPTYEQERSAQQNSTAALFAALPANVRSTIKTTTQAGCECSPLNWTYYPSIINDAQQPFMAYVGCANPDNDPQGDWCVVDPKNCPSFYGAKQPQPGDVPANMMNRYYFDYCGPVRNKTEAGCLCMGNWKPTFNSSLESRPNPNGAGILPDPTKVTRFSGGVCGNPPELQRERNWCYVDYRTCQTQPAGRAQPSGPAADELWYDFCPASTPAAAPSTTAVAPVLPATSAFDTAGTTTPPASPAAPPAASPSPTACTPGSYLPCTVSPSPSPPVSAGIYLPSTGGASPAPSGTPPASPAPGSPVPTTTAGGSTPTAVSVVPGTNGSASQAAQAATNTTSNQQQGKKQVPIAAIVAPIVVGVVIIAAVVGALLWRRHRRCQQAGGPGGKHWASSAALTGGGGVAPGGGSGGARYPSVKYPFISGMATDLEKGSNSEQQSGKGTELELPKNVGPSYYTAGAAAGRNGVYVGHVKDTGAMPPANTSYFSAVGSSSVSDSSSMYGSEVPLMGVHAGGTSSGPGKDPFAVGHAESPGSSSSGLPSGPPTHTPAAVARRNDVAAAAAVEAEARAASLASMWESRGSMTRKPYAAGVHAAGAALAPMHEDEQYVQDSKKAHLPARPRGSAEPQPPPAFGRIASNASPFAAGGFGLLPQLASTDPSGLPYPADSGPVGPAALLDQDLHRADDLSRPLTGALAKEQQQRLVEGGLNVVLRHNTPPGGFSNGSRPPATPSNQEQSRKPGFNGSPANSSGSGSKRVSWLFGSHAAQPAAREAEEVQTWGGDSQLTGMSGLTGLTGMSWGGTDKTSRPGDVQTSHTKAAAQGSSGVPQASGGFHMVPSVAPPATRHMSGPGMDPNWNFDRVGTRPVRVLLQVSEDDPHKPVTLLLLVSAPPPKPEVLAQVVLPTDKPIAGVNMAIDANTELAFPSNSFLGQGAFGQVHRALYKGRHPVAVKMLTDPDLRNADPETLRSFKEELGIMVKLEHPNIVKCYGGNIGGSNPFIVTELCECSLDKMINHYKRKYNTGLPLRHTLTIGLQIASALWHMHPSVVHRDLKPQNVLLDSVGTAKVTDFGLSRIKTHTYVSTQHVEAGTASYMAPECFSNQGVSEKVDVYSLAMLLLECVEGVRPWKGCNMVQVAFQVAMQDTRPPIPQADPEHCPAELVQLIIDCWATNPKERPSSGEVMKRLAQMIRMYVHEE